MTTTVSLAVGTTLAQAISQINGRCRSLGVHAQLNTAGTGLDLQGTAAFTVSFERRRHDRRVRR